MVNTTPEIMKRETPKGGSQVSVRGYVRWKSKEWSRFSENPERPSISPKEKFRNVCWFRTEKSTEKVFSRPVPEDEGTCGFIQRVPAGARRAISAQKKIDPETGRSDPAEVGGLHQVVSEPLSVCRLQAEGGRVDKENTLIHTIMWYQS
jgi:hypothetical protein